MIKGIFRTGNTKNILIISGRYKNFVANSKVVGIRSPKCSNTSFIHIGYTQRRFCSSNSAASAIHKVLFVSAESPDSSESNVSNNSDIYISADSIEYIPPPPSIPPEATEEAAHVLNALGEPTFQSLGLGGWSPVGLFQNCLEFLHVSVDLPWWGAISVATVVIRLALFPLVIKTQRNNAIMNNFLPKLQALQNKMSEARISGNNYEAARLSFELQEFMKKSGVNPLKNMLVPLIQAPIFISVFMGLRKCANLPVESMKEGGLFWFMDLTVADPFYLLPIITMATLSATIELGVDSQQLQSVGTSKVIRHVFRALPIVMFPFVCHFPGAILCYWMSTNFISLMQVAFLKIPAVRTYFKINRIVKHDKDKLPQKSKGVLKDIKEAWGNMKISSEVADRQKLNEIRFKKAGTGPLVKTYKQNPIAVKAKERDT